MASPPAACRVSMSPPKFAWLIGMPLSPFQYGVQEPAEAVWMNAMVRYLLPEAEASADRLSPLYASKYGADTWAGSGVAACAAPAPVSASPAEAATVTSPVSTARGRAHARPGIVGGVAGLRTGPVMDR